MVKKPVKSAAVLHRKDIQENKSFWEPHIQDVHQRRLADNEARAATNSNARPFTLEKEDATSHPRWRTTYADTKDRTDTKLQVSWGPHEGKRHNAAWTITGKQVEGHMARRGIEGLADKIRLAPYFEPTSKTVRLIREIKDEDENVWGWTMGVTAAGEEYVFLPPSVCDLSIKDLSQRSTKFSLFIDTLEAEGLAERWIDPKSLLFPVESLAPGYVKKMAAEGAILVSLWKLERPPAKSEANIKRIKTANVGPNEEKFGFKVKQTSVNETGGTCHFTFTPPSDHLFDKLLVLTVTSIKPDLT